MDRSIVVFFTDSHGGHRLGLLNPDTLLFEEQLVQVEELGGALRTVIRMVSTPYHPPMTKTQERIWQWYEEDIQGVRAIAGSDRVHVVHGGDPTQGNHYPREWVSTKQSDQIHIATANMEAWFDALGDLLWSFRFINGTGVHEFGEGSASNLIADKLRDRHPGTFIEAAYHYDLTVDGVTFDIAHHGPGPGIRNWLKGNVLRLYTKSLMMDDIQDGKEPPNVVLRGHHHGYMPESVTHRARSRTYRTDAFTCPSYCLVDEFARKVINSPAHVTIGLLAFEIIDGRLHHTHEFLRTLDIRTKEVITNERPRPILRTGGDTPAAAGSTVNEVDDLGARSNHHGGGDPA